MSSLKNKSSCLPQVTEILNQLGEELAFTIPGEDMGLLSIHQFLIQLEELAQPDAPPTIRSALLLAREWLDQSLHGSGKFTAESLRNLNVWHAYMSEALFAWERNTPMPAWPETWPQNQPPTPPPSQQSTPSPTDPNLEEKEIRLNFKEDAELLHEFHGESEELLQNIEHGLIALEKNPSDAATIHSVFRAFHTFKGGAGFLRLGALRDLAHDLESLLDAARRSELLITSEMINLILAGADTLKQFVREIGTQIHGTNVGEPIIVPTRQLILRLQAALRGEIIPPSFPTPSVPQIIPPQPILGPGMEIAPGSFPPTSFFGEGTSGFVKLDTWKLDNLVDLVGELAIAQSMVVHHPDVENLTNTKLANYLRVLGRTTAELRRDAMSLRMIPIRGIFQKMTRLVRDLAVQQHKQVQLLIEGEDTELDRNIVEKLADPLVHMIRNAIDHGLELPDERISQNKPPLGIIRLAASYKRGGIAIQIRDNGRGLDTERILAKARERGLITPENQPTEAEILQLIFMPSFSTADRITDLSGRGVGLDIVRRNIEKLRGKIEIESVAGQGTTFTLLLPLTLASIDGLMVGIGEDRYLIPTLSVLESFRPKPGMVTKVQEHGEVVNLRGRQIPVLRMGPFLGRPTRAVNPEDGILVVVESGTATRALLVDELIGKQEVIIKSLGETFRHQHLVAGAAVLSDGTAGLIFDVDALVKLS